MICAVDLATVPYSRTADFALLLCDLHPGIVEVVCNTIIDDSSLQAVLLVIKGLTRLVYELHIFPCIDNINSKENKGNNL